jgi:hypothetical protein
MFEQAINSYNNGFGGKNGWLQLNYILIKADKLKRVVETKII